MPGLWKHADGTVSRIAQPYDGTQLAATARLADGTEVPVIDFHTRIGERDQLVLPNGIEILSLDVTAASPWSFNGNSGVVNGRKNYVAPGGPVSNPVLGWSAGSANGGSSATVSSNGAYIQVANNAANNGVATKSFSTTKNKKYTFSVTLQNGSNPGTSFYLTIGTSRYGVQIADLSQASGISLPKTVSYTFTATGSSVSVALGNQATSGAISIWSVPTLVIA